MGGAVSSGCDNDDLIDKLKEKEYIKTREVEQVFRMVDRAHYYLEEARDTAYEDLAWKNGTLHLSAPCIYSKVMEALELKKGMSFLNLGSGTGYLSTMVGFAIGPYGINHGVELHSENVAYAKKRLGEFIETGPKFDDLELCEPQFVVGNCLNLAPDNRLYDRVYCGAACPPEQLELLQQMIKVGGILVTPVGDQLLKLKRQSDLHCSSENVLPVSFASLVLPATRQNPEDLITMPKVNPLTLQSITRIVIRDAIRATFEFKLPEVSKSKSRRKSKRSDSEDSLHAPLSIVPREFTRDGVMIMRIGGSLFQGRSHLVLPFRERPQGLSTAANGSESDNSAAVDADEDGNDEGEEDGDMLDRELQFHAQTLQRLREGSASAPRPYMSHSDVDTDMSDDESDKESLLFDINGNSNKDPAVGNPRESHGAASKLEAEASSSSQESQNPRKKKRVVTRSTREVDHSSLKAGKVEKAEAEKFSNVKKILNKEEKNIPENLLEQDPILLDHKVKAEKSENSRTNVSKRQASWKNHTASLSSDDGLVLCGETDDQDAITNIDETSVASAGSSSVGIDVPPSSSASKPCKIQKQVSYSTSADTSETSGFGSLGDSFKDRSMFLPSDHFDASSPEVDVNPWQSMSMPESVSKENGSLTEVMPSNERDIPKPPVDILGASERKDSDSEDPEGKVGNGQDDLEQRTDSVESDSNMNMSHMLAQFSKLVERGQSDSDSDKFEDSDGEEGSDEEDTSRAQDFSAYLKEKVDTLPIPNSIKSYILHYRGNGH